LIEVLVAISVLVFITMLLYGAFSGLQHSKEGISRINERYHEGRNAMRRITDELQTAYLSMNAPIDPQLLVVKTAFVGKQGSPGDRLDFNSFANRRFERDTHESDQAEISYYTMANPDEPGVNDLVRRISDRPDLEPDKGGKVEVLATDIDLFDLQYLDPYTGLWSDEWDSSQELGQFARLPLQVRVKLVLNGGRRTASDRAAEPIVFVTKVPLPIQQPLSFAGAGK
jgi:general secretion pathway protein J